MAIIALEGARFYAYHGFYEEEQVIGNEFLLDVYIMADTRKAVLNDNLFDTVNYETLYLICQSEMKKPCKLLETVAQRIIDRIRDLYGHVSAIKVKLRKLSPPLGGRVQSASVELSVGKWT